MFRNHNSEAFTASTSTTAEKNAEYFFGRRFLSRDSNFWHFFEKGNTDFLRTFIRDSTLEFYTLFRCFVSFMHAVNVFVGYLLFMELHAEIIRKSFRWDKFKYVDCLKIHETFKVRHSLFNFAFNEIKLLFKGRKQLVRNLYLCKYPRSNNDNSLYFQLSINKQNVALTKFIPLNLTFRVERKFSSSYSFVSASNKLLIESTLIYFHQLSIP